VCEEGDAGFEVGGDGGVEDGGDGGEVLDDDFEVREGFC
jgi:hypothetical protein